MKSGEQEEELELGLGLDSRLPNLRNTSSNSCFLSDI